ncbi:YiiX/YebB-like N1pC/P60 family cysteine hydrolase [Pedobacter aquatilis]|uniref:YiiX/YebB-like N1pC/P60 family cysteine hydrolase n=1 Tax=Pedobacter aquatilis TaxID=351343 RepID=UPI0025B2E657|nr:YiiX/YebB-like N1pC/P60 family cysteine hydrolase [Pedobacter aquatilis]MDN3585658.1 YiiX/YebB-like N1pC/P60 family cysteine hydrolase [Pedobacter aquatilis]
MSKFLLNLPILQSGDIILIRSEERESLFIQEQSGCRYSHAMLYVGESSYIESDGLGVHAFNAARKLFDGPTDAIALRFKDAESTPQVDAAVEYVRLKIGTEYSTAEARRAARNPAENAAEENRQFCSRLVGQAYAYAGIPITENPNYATPKQLLESQVLLHITDILQEATAEQIAYASEQNTVLDQQTEATNTILESARNMTGKDLQTLEQLSDFMQESLQYDGQITAVVKGSGYLDLWKTDEAKNPMYYDFEKLKEDCPEDKLEQAGRQLCYIASGNLARYYQMQEAYNWQVLLQPTAYNLLFKDLYDNLVRQGERMFETGAAAIKHSTKNS